MTTVWVRGSRPQGGTGEIVLPTSMVTEFFPAGNHRDSDFHYPAVAGSHPLPDRHFRPALLARPYGSDAGTGG